VVFRWKNGNLKEQLRNMETKAAVLLQLWERKKREGQQKGDLGLPVQKYCIAENRCSLQRNSSQIIQ